ncbi:MAG: FecR domain-containing protein [Sphingobacterium sp.]|jgi:ferric-dicitrate binding protein FerR (iron transport regulator)|nr:FecR domain-containing protein [Sphingobacterium sp.]
MERIDPKLLKKYAEGRASEKECEEVEQWLEEEDNFFDPRAGVGAANERPVHGTLSAMWQHFIRQTDEGLRYLRLWWWGTRLTGALLVLVLGVIVYKSEYRLLTADQDIELLTVEVPNGQRATIKLSDSTQIFLAGGSKLVYPKVFVNNERRLSLEYGHAFLKVAKDPSKPFILQSDGTQVSVLGTAFDVSNRIGSKDIAVVLQEGAVAFSDARGVSQIMKPGDKLVYDKGSGQVSHYQGRDVTRLDSWTDGKLDFRSAHLEDVLLLLGERFDKKIECSKDVIHIPVTGAFNDMPLRRVLFLLSESTGLEFVEKNNTITVKR